MLETITQQHIKSAKLALIVISEYTISLNTFIKWLEWMFTDVGNFIHGITLTLSTLPTSLADDYSLWHTDFICFCLKSIRSIVPGKINENLKMLSLFTFNLSIIRDYKGPFTVSGMIHLMSLNHLEGDFQFYILWNKHYLVIMKIMEVPG